MKTVLFAGLAMAAGLSVAGGASAQDDDWEFQEDASQRITVAAVRYDAGQMIVVQCREGGLTAVVTGLPVSQAQLDLGATRADGRRSRQIWRPAGAPGAYSSAAAGQDVRFLRGGGLWTVRSHDGAATPVRATFDLPTQFANLDRVLTACNWSTTDDRDQLADASEVISLVDPDAAAPTRQWQSRSVSQSRRSSPPQAPTTPSAPLPSEHQVSCIVREMHLRECRADHPGSAQVREVAMTIRFNEGREVFPLEGVDPGPAEGRVVRLVGGRVVVIDYLATVPAR